MIVVACPRTLCWGNWLLWALESLMLCWMRRCLAKSVSSTSRWVSRPPRPLCAKAEAQLFTTIPWHCLIPTLAHPITMLPFRLWLLLARRLLLDSRHMELDSVSQADGRHGVPLVQTRSEGHRPSMRHPDGMLFPLGIRFLL